jgi:hypothetical protein
MPEILALIGLVIATVLYALVVRRRSFLRVAGASMSRALAASNDIALSRMRLGFRAPPTPPSSAAGDWRDGIVVSDRRSGRDRRKSSDRRLGRGRRTGGDRRRSEDSV